MNKAAERKLEKMAVGGATDKQKRESRNVFEMDDRLEGISIMEELRKHLDPAQNLDRIVGREIDAIGAVAKVAQSDMSRLLEKNELTELCHAIIEWTSIIRRLADQSRQSLRDEATRLEPGK
jgi:hypothetical protein